MIDADVIVVGAGVAGLSCARELRREGLRVVVFEKSRGVGGRCATRRIDGQPVDHGVAFLHGRDPDLVSEFESVPDVHILRGWPHRVSGRGRPCQPDALGRHETRLAYREGVSAFPKFLAQGLDVRLLTSVSGLGEAAGGVHVRAEGRTQPWTARHVVLALAVEQSAVLLETAASMGGDAAAALALLRMAGSVPCLTVIAGYIGSGPEPVWDILYPEDSEVLQLVVRDSAKRDAPRDHVLVLQARPAWSRARLRTPTEEWTAALLAEAARIIAPSAGDPMWVQSHLWRWARIDRGNELSGPFRVRLDGGGTIGLAGEYFAPGGGIEAAWRSGRALARRLLSEE